LWGPFQSQIEFSRKWTRGEDKNLSMTTGYVVGPCFEKSANVVESPVMNNIRENIETVLLAVGAGERTRARFRIEPI